MRDVDIRYACYAVACGQPMLPPICRTASERGVKKEQTWLVNA